jgi:sensor histidine kinase regulating citrate/malate metabolism
LFQRSFSTKASAGRGIGTYSVKLLVEQYLKGSVSFISDSESKTIFTLKIPLIK